MTETKWLAGQHLDAMADHAWQVGSERKLRLVGCGCCRLVWDRLVDARSQHAVEVAERAADGDATDEDCHRAEYRAEAACFAIDEKAEDYRKERDYVVRGILAEEDAFRDPFITSRNRVPISLRDARIAAEAAEHAVATLGVFMGRGRHPLLSVSLLRDIFGNPFRPVVFDPSWRSDTALSLARQMYDSRDFSAMPILADALQDMGCEDEQVLTHCRGEGVHVRGCWVVDLVLGKE